MDENRLTFDKLVEAMRKLDPIPSDDVIAVSYLFPSGKVLRFDDDRGTVWALGESAWAALRAEATISQSKPAHWGSMPVVMCDRDDPIARQTKERVLRSMQAGVDVSEALADLFPAPTTGEQHDRD